MLFLACADQTSGESLAKRHCASCHAFPEPSMLTKNTWQAGVLPEMAFRMGLDISRFPLNEAEVKEIMKVLPTKPAVTEEEWQRIRAYYLSTAPDSLSANDAREAFPLHQFEATGISLPVNSRNMLTLIRKDTLTGAIYTGTRQGNLYRLDTAWRPVDSLALGSAPSSIVFNPAALPLVACMGIMDPNDQPAGSVIRLTGTVRKAVTLIDSLKRPVDLQQADLNNDQREDLVVSGFGNFTGGLYVYEQTEEALVPHIIHAFPGTRKTIVRDVNDDGLPDILALISQGDEQIALLTNRGNFRFAYRVLMRFPPVYGSSFFELCDINGDGHEDILYTNGDNADFSTILKPYHGVRLFLNDGKNQFSESWFYPMHGASMARAIDFDEDGDLDIAAISFFPDFERRPQETFVYLENDNGIFKPFETPVAAASRWISMEIVDVDNDRDNDIILAALAFPTGVPEHLYGEWRKKNLSLLVLKNNLR